MGLTVHYSFESRTKSKTKARELVEKMRQICMDLAFYKVCDVQEFNGVDCDYTKRDKNEAIRWLLVQARQSVIIPWTKSRGKKPQVGECYVDVPPYHVICCNVWGLNGSEPMNVGLCRYPKEIELEYNLEDDARFRSSHGCNLDYHKWHRYCDRKGYVRGSNERLPSHWREKRKVKTGLGSKWYWSSFCKTQYASDPACGGIPNFLRAHISVITALERIAELPTLKVSIDDEGNYGSNLSCPEGHHNPAKLVKEISEWNKMSAAFFGAMNDALKTSSSEMGVKSPFEQLSTNDNRVNKFLEIMNSIQSIASDGLNKQL